MPGIFGSVANSGHIDAEQLFNAMAVAMDADGHYQFDRYVRTDHHVITGRSCLGVFNALEQPIFDPNNGCKLLFHGELYNNPGNDSDPEFVLSEYNTKGDRCAVELNGIFHFAILDDKQRKLKLFSDKFGLQPIYYSVVDGGFTFGASVKSVLQDHRVDKTPNFEAFADFFRFTHALGNKTLFRDIHLLPPGAVLTYDMDKGNVEITRYWHLESLFIQDGRYPSGITDDVVVDMLVESIRRRATRKDLLGISLSGGLDSRGLLAALGDGAQGIHSYTLGLEGCADQRLAQRMAAVGNTRHTFVALEPSYLEQYSDMARTMIELTDGLYHPHESTEMLALEHLKKVDFKILMRGHGGELAKAALAHPVQASAQSHSIADADGAIDFIFNSASQVSLSEQEISNLFRKDMVDTFIEGPLSSIRQSVGDFAGRISTPDLCIYYYAKEWIRRQVVASLEIFRTQVEIRMPYVDELFLDPLLTLPVEKRNQGEIHLKLVSRFAPELMKIPNSNTGAPLSAGPLRLLLTDKFNSLMKKLGVKGFRHYTAFSDWYRNAFRNSVSQIIFSDRAQSRGLYHRQELQRIFNAHVAGKKGYNHLLGTVVSLELWYQAYVDGSS
jgi:asparagine synthase (glutamine-hydrolysing)